MVKFTVADSSDDLVSIRVEYNVEEGFPEEGWSLALPAESDISEIYEPVIRRRR